MEKRQNVFGSSPTGLQVDAQIRRRNHFLDVIGIVFYLQERFLIERKRALKQVEDVDSKRPDISFH